MRVLFLFLLLFFSCAWLEKKATERTAARTLDKKAFLSGDIFPACKEVTLTRSHRRFYERFVHLWFESKSCVVYLELHFPQNFPLSLDGDILITKWYLFLEDTNQKLVDHKPILLTRKYSGWSYIYKAKTQKATFRLYLLSQDGHEPFARYFSND